MTTTVTPEPAHTGQDASTEREQRRVGLDGRQVERRRIGLAGYHVERRALGLDGQRRPPA